MKNLLALLCIAAVAATGCSNPADTAPAASVGDTPAVETPAETAAAPAEASAEDAAPAEAAPAAGATSYVMSVDDTYIGFAGSKSLAGVTIGTHYGQFPAFEGTVAVTGEDLTTAVFNVTIDMKELTTDNGILTNTLKNEDFFNVEKFPTAAFASTAVAKTDDGYTVTGNLSILGNTKEISFPATMDLANGSLTGSAEFSINRHDFGLTSPGYMDNAINDDVVLSLDITAAPAA